MNFSLFAKSPQDNLKDITVLFGDDVFLTNKAKEIIFSYLKTPKDAVNVFDCENYQIKPLLKALEQTSFFAEKNVVLLKDIPKVSEADKKALVNYSQNPNECTLFLIIANKGFEKFEFLKNAQFVDCSRLADDKLKKYVVTELAKANKKINEDALQTLIEYTGGYLASIAGETQKLASYEANLITVQDIELGVTKTQEYQIFELTESLARRDGDKAIMIVKNIIDTKSDVFSAYSLIASYFRRLFYVSTSPLDNAELSNAFGVKEYAIKKAREQKNAFSIKQLKAICEEIVDIDYKVKIGEMPQNNALYYIVTFILSK